MKTKKGKIIHIFLMLYVIITLYPIFWGFQNSFKLHVDVVGSPFALIKNFTIDNYIQAWESSKISTYFFNSVYISLISSVVTIILSAMTAYALTRMLYNRMNKVVTGVFLLAMMVPVGSLLIPLYLMIKKLSDFGIPLYDTHWSLILPYITFGLSLTIIILMAFIRSIPRELEEAGIMDGLSVYGIFSRIVLPLMLPAVITVFIINFLGNWNEFILANVMLSKESLRTLPVGMVAFQSALNTNYGGLLASAMYSIVPVMILFAVLQERIIEGLTAGSVKG